MSNRSASSPPPSILRSGGKRLRFDPTPSTASNTAPASANADKKISPSAAAKERIKATVATLPKELQTTASSLATNIFLAYTKWYNKDKKCKDVSNDSDNFPKPLQFKVELQLMKEVTKGPDFNTLSSELDAAVLEARKALKPLIVRGMELERDFLRTAVMKAVATALPTLAELLLAFVDGETYGKHTLVRDFISIHQDEVMTYLGITNQDFAKIYLEANQLTSLPPTNAFPEEPAVAQQGQGNPVTPLAAQATGGNNNGAEFQVEEEMDTEADPFAHDLSPSLSQPAGTQHPPPSPAQHATLAQRFRPIIGGHETCVNHLRALISAFAQAKEVYHKIITENATQARIAKVMGNQEKSKVTDSTAELLDEEANVDPAIFNSLTDQRFEAKAKPLRQDVASMKTENKKLKETVKRLENQMKALKKSPKDQGGAEGGAASTNKSEQPTTPSSTPRRGRGRRAGGKGNATRGKSSNRGSSRSRSKSPSKRSGKATRRGKSNRRSSKSS